MNEQNKAYRAYILNKEHHALRTDRTPDTSLFTVGSLPERMKERFKALLSLQDTVFIENETFIPTRTCIADPDILTEADSVPEKMHERGWLSNICPDYGKAVSHGLLYIRDEITDAAQKTDDADKKAYASVMCEMIDAILAFADRYRDAARLAGRNDIAATLERVPRYGATGYREALQSFRILHYSLCLEG